MAFGFLKKAVKGAVRGVKKVGKVASSPVMLAANPVVFGPIAMALKPKKTLKTAMKAYGIARPYAGTAALAIPGIGPGVSAGLAVADSVIAKYNAGNSQQKAAAGRIIAATKAMAKKGSVPATNAVTILNKRAAAMRMASRFRVRTDGFVIPVT